MNKICASSWGIEIFDQLTKGLPKGDISVVETPNYHIGQVILGKFLYQGLLHDETCVFVTYDTMTTFLENFLNWNLDFKKYIDSQKLILLNYNPNISNEVGLSHQYSALFHEIKRLSGIEKIDRIAFQQVDTLINLNNLILMNHSAQKLEHAAQEPITKGATVLGQFVQFNDKVHKNLSIALQKTMAGYFTVSQMDEMNPFDLIFMTKKLPWFNYYQNPTQVYLKEGEGIVLDRISQNESA